MLGEASYHTAKKCSQAHDTWLLGGSTLTSHPGCEATAQPFLADKDTETPAQRD